MAIIDTSFPVTGGETNRPPNNVKASERQITIRAPFGIPSADQWSGQKVWLLLPGFTAPANYYDATLATAIKNAHPDDAVLALDWTQVTDTRENNALAGIFKGDHYRSVSWVTPVATAVRDKLFLWGMPASALNMVGHSLGSFLASEIAASVNTTYGGQVGSVTALDPASNTGKLGSPYDTTNGFDTDLSNGYLRNGGIADPIKPFNLGAATSRSFNGISSVAGNEAQAGTAKESFLFDFSNPLTDQHAAVVTAYTNLVTTDANGNSRLVNNILGLDDTQADHQFRPNFYKGNSPFSVQVHEGVIPVDAQNNPLFLVAAKPNGETDDRYIYGTNGNDEFRQTGTFAKYYNNNGNHTYIVGNGNDVVFGGIGNDIIFGGQGNDTADGGDGNNRIYGEDGNDILGAGTGNDTLFGGTGNDTINTGDGANLIFGDGGEDSLRSGTGNDTLFGGTGNDTINSGDGANIIFGDEGEDSLRGGIGNDSIYGGDGNDTSYGGAGNDTIDGGNGNNLISGEDGNDSLIAGTGNDTSYGGAGNDTVDGGNGINLIFGDDGNDVLIAGTGSDTIYGGVGNDTIDGGNGTNNLYGQDGDDYLTGGNGINRLFGGFGNDYLQGGTGGTNLLKGTDSTTMSPNEIDTLTGNPSARQNAFYIGDGKINWYSANRGNDYAYIVNFNPNTDIILGGTNYVEAQNMSTQTFLWAANELIAKIEGLWASQLESQFPTRTF